MRLLILSVVALVLGQAGCTPTRPRGDGEGDADADSDADNDTDTGPEHIPEPPTPNPDAFFADDPPPQYCGPEGEPRDPPEVPGGTPECPDDKNREGCPCEVIDEVAPCWPGLRVNRNRGICQDGTTTCAAYDEFQGAWGPCEGYVLPVQGAELGPDSCQCFSAGRWEIDNLSPCFIDYGGAGIFAVSTFIQPNGQATCPTDWENGPPPVPEPGQDFSTNRLTVDCAGRFELCFTLRAGRAEEPRDSDCVLMRVCTEAWYGEANVEQELPPLPSWTSDNPACAEAFATTGGYGEMSVLGLSIECEDIDDDGEPYVFNRIGYCPVDCAERPNAADCRNCGQGGSGNF